jgi:hypothetical protein
MADLDTSGIDAVVAELKKLPATATKLLRKLAQAVIDEAGKNISAQRGPDGEPWPATKDGRTALANAKKALSYQVSGRVAVVTLSGVEGRHHFGWVKGGKRRPILPGSQAPILSKALQEACQVWLNPAIWKGAA